MKIWLKRAGWCVLGLLGLVVLAYLVLVAVNWHDAPQGAAAKRLLQEHAQRAPVADADNGFVYLLGFLAGPDQDPMALGVQRLAMYSPPPGTQRSFFDEARTPFGATPALFDTLKKSCKPVTQQCILALDANVAAIDEALQTRAGQLERYRALVSKPAWREAIPRDTQLPMPRYAEVLEGQQLLYLNAWRLARQGDSSAVATLLKDDGVFWRRVFASSDTLISKMIATAALMRHFEWGNLVLRNLPKDAAQAAMPAHWRSEFAVSERSMLRVSAGEYIWAKNTVAPLMAMPQWTESDLPAFADRLMMSVSAQQDFYNRYASLVAQVSDTLDVPYRAYPAALGRARTHVRESADRAFERPLYNLPFNFLLRAAPPDFTDYAARLTDVEGVRRAVLLAVQLRAKGAENIEVELGGATLRDPYTGRAFGWDGNAITFTGLARPPRGRHAIVY